jgi:hypothetical protein
MGINPDSIIFIIYKITAVGPGQRSLFERFSAAGINRTCKRVSGNDWENLVGQYLSLHQLTTWWFRLNINEGMKDMAKKARINLYFEDEVIKKQIKIAAAKRGISTTAYCAGAIQERLQRDGEKGNEASNNRLALLVHMDNLRREMGCIDMTTAELVAEGRWR